FIQGKIAAMALAVFVAAFDEKRAASVSVVESAGPNEMRKFLIRTDLLMAGEYRFIHPHLAARSRLRCAVSSFRRQPQLWVAPLRSKSPRMLTVLPHEQRHE